MCYVHVLFIFIIIKTRSRHGVEVIGSMEPNIEKEKNRKHQRRHRQQ